MPPTGTNFENYLLQVEPHWVTLGKMLPGMETPGAQEGVQMSADHGQNTMTGNQGHPLSHRAAAALKLIRNHEAVVRDVCNPNTCNTVGKQLTMLHLKRVPVELVQYVEEALRYVAIKLLGVPPPTMPPGVVPVLDPNNRQQCQAWIATTMFVMARLQIGQEKPGRAPDLAPDASMAMRCALMETGRYANGL